MGHQVSPKDKQEELNLCRPAHFPPQAPHLEPYLVTAEGVPGMSQAKNRNTQGVLAAVPFLGLDRQQVEQGWAGRGEMEHREGKQPRDPEGLQSHGKRWGSGVWWLTPVIPALRYLRQEDRGKFETNLGYTARLCLKKGEKDTHMHVRVHTHIQRGG